MAFGLNVQQSVAAPARDEILARVHWLGLKQISADTGAAHFMSVWQLPQTTTLLTQTLDKLSRCPGGGDTNAASALLRPLLDDLVSSEFHLEVYSPANSQFRIRDSQFFLAVRLPAERARLWQANLAAVHGWWLQKSHTPERIEFSRVGRWTLVGFGRGTNNLLPEFAARIARSQAPFVTNFWLEADLDPSRLADCFSSDQTRGELGAVNYLSSTLKTIDHLNFTITGEAGDVLTRGTLDFSRLLDAPLPSWEIPANFIHQSLTSFTAVRGLASWLAGLPAWQKLQIAPSPGQMFFWAQDGVPFQTYFAAALPSASNELWQLAGRLMQNANPWLDTNGEGNFLWSTNLPGLVWQGASILSPFLKPVIVNQHDYILGGLYPLTRGGFNLPLGEKLRSILRTTNLVYYQSEQTGERVEDGLFITQLFRLVLHKQQLPPTAALWLKNIEPLLGDSTTVATQTAPSAITFTRHSTFGFTALELHLFADWLESPEFPRGLHSSLAR